MREYVIQGPAGEITVLLTEEEAKARGAKLVQTKAKTPKNKAVEPEDKARTTADKRSEVASKAFGAKKKTE